MVDAVDLIEEQALELANDIDDRLNANTIHSAILLSSIAISLRRIADALEKPQVESPTHEQLMEHLSASLTEALMPTTTATATVDLTGRDPPIG
jgi:hypothetical protein